MDTVNGNDVLLFLGDSSTPTNYLPVVCLQNLTWGRNRSTNKTETKCGTFNSNGSTDYSCTASGLLIENADGSAEYGHNDLVQLFTDNSTKKWKIAPAIPKVGNEIKTFEGVVNTLNDTYGTNALATFDLTILPDPTTVEETVNADATVTLTSNNVASGNVAVGSTNNILYIAKMVNLSSETPTAIATTLTGTYDASDLDNVKLYVNGNAAIDGGETLIDTVVATADTAPHLFSFTNSNALATGSHYFIVTADIASGADVGHTIIASKLTFTGLSGTTTDSQTPNGGTKTVA